MKDNLPKDIRLGASTLDMLLECCGGVGCSFYCDASCPGCTYPNDNGGVLYAAEFVQLVASEANTISEEEKKKTLNPEHVVSALERLGLSVFLDDVKAMWSELKESEQSRSEIIPGLVAGHVIFNPDNPSGFQGQHCYQPAHVHHWPC